MKKEKNTAKTDTNINTKKVKENSVKEIGGPKGLEPTRYGDWEREGKCVDF